MMRTALPRTTGLLPSASPSCTCARQASHYPASLSTASAPPPPPPPAPSTSLFAQPTTPTLEHTLDNPAWSDPAYLKRYRNPSRHDARLPPSRRLETAAKPGARSHSVASTSASTASGNGNGGTVKGQRSRRNRLEMEALWSGGDFSPPIPLESYRAQTTRPRHALLFPGSGSQYVGMGAFLREQKPAQDVWAEADEALAGFEEWRRGLKLHEHDGELGQLGRMLDETEAARRREPGLREVVFEGPQVRLSLSRFDISPDFCRPTDPLSPPLLQDELTRSSNAQPAILVTSTAFLRTLEVRSLPLSFRRRAVALTHDLLARSASTTCP